MISILQMLTSLIFSLVAMVLLCLGKFEAAGLFYIAAELAEMNSKK